jgi:hypothetical protein
MRFKEVLSRVTGLSVPVFGVSWNPPESQIRVARRVIAFLEDRRVLYVPSEMEVPYHCIESVIEIRRFLTTELQALHGESQLADALQAMRAACRKFMDVTSQGSEIVEFGAHRGHWASWHFNGAIGELRGVFGVHIARLAASHGLDVEQDLASILPGVLDDDLLKEVRPGVMTKMDMIWISVASMIHPDIDDSKTVSRKEIESRIQLLFGTTITPVMLEKHLVSFEDRQADKANPQRGGSRNRYLFRTVSGREPSSAGHFRLYKKADSKHDGWEKTGKIRPDRSDVPKEFWHLLDWYEGRYA